MRYSLRMMKPEDLPGVMELEETCFTTPWSKDVFLDELGRDDSICFVAVDQKGALAGFVMARVFFDDVHILNLTVKKDLRRLGLGSKMVKKALENARKLGAVGATLEVRSKNRAAIRLYEGFGFVSVGKRKGYYDDPKDDAVIMWLYDISGLLEKTP